MLLEEKGVPSQENSSEELPSEGLGLCVGKNSQQPVVR